MRLRRKRILSALRPGGVALSMTCFPLMGVGDFVAVPTPSVDPGNTMLRSLQGLWKGWRVRGPATNSAYVPDDVVYDHPRFQTLTKNIRVS